MGYDRADIVFIITSFFGNTLDGRFMVSVGANYAPYVIRDWQWWRLITCMFLHFGYGHLLGNMFGLAVYGISLEKSVGHIRFLIVYMVSGLFSGLTSCVVHYITGDYVVSAGASGAIYGLIGLAIALTIRERGRTGSGRMIYRLAIILVFIFYSNFMSSGVDVYAHIGGLVAGVVLGLIVTGGKKNARS